MVDHATNYVTSVRLSVSEQCRLPLPWKGLWLQNALAFAMHRRAFAIDKPLRLPPNAFFSLEANAPHIMLQTTPLFPRKLFIALTFQDLLPLPSKCLCVCCLRCAFPFAIEGPQPSKDLFLQANAQHIMLQITQPV